ncbi:MAG: hypothetical protein JRJ86_01040 [Deltaproteobacteria bacterium]|nr:hypothetical protein [Deltaproteobacteria bacterium]MBW2117699.1 hypothetical protein [Deltaproteobacteria bacterium]MBW2344138.1 hypothetical protein [Deltaproteobacteria bacterium]
MSEIDEWGRDPSVQKMRGVFSRMEAAQRKLLEQVGISSLDIRLRQAREKARGLFERTWSHAATQDLDMGDDAVAGLYSYCLAWALGHAGIEVPGKFLSDDKRLRDLITDLENFS